MLGVDDRIDAASARHRDDFAHGHDEPCPVAQMREQDKADARIGLERCLVAVDQPLVRRGFGKRDTDDVDASAMFQRVTARLHAVVIEVGIKHRVTGTQPVVAGDQRLERLGRICLLYTSRCV